MESRNLVAPSMMMVSSKNKMMKPFNSIMQYDFDQPSKFSHDTDDSIGKKHQQSCSLPSFDTIPAKS